MYNTPKSNLIGNLMQLVRNTSLPKEIKTLCAGPVPGGIFWAFKHNDLPRGRFVNADVPNLLKHGKLWVGKAGYDPDWKEITSIRDLPKFKAVFGDSYDSCMSGWFISPFMPQFYWVPNNSFRGQKIYKKCK